MILLKLFNEYFPQFMINTHAYVYITKFVVCSVNLYVPFIYALFSATE
jgi:hypothetical protein